MPEKRIPTRPFALLAASGLALAAASASLGQSDPLSERFPAVLELADLDGAIGFRLDGVDADDQSGWSVASAGDVNGDGIDDLIIGARHADPGGRFRAGVTYVVFGRDAAAGGFPAVLQLVNLDGVTGFRLDGIDVMDASGTCVASAGDVNGDGIDDLIIGAKQSGPGGQTYVVFGRNAAMGGFPAALQLSSVDGVTGFRIRGTDGSGPSVASAGDVNGDGIDDLVIGVPYAGLGYRGYYSAGAAYVVFGCDAAMGGFPATFELANLDGTTGFRIDPVDRDDAIGVCVASAGDVNGDGFDDVIIGAPFADPGGGRLFFGTSYVVFGRGASMGGFSASVQLSSLDGVIGFRLDGVDYDDLSGGAVASAGDINGDGIDDLIIGARHADPGGRVYAGESYVVFGRDATMGGFPAAVQLSSLDGVTGFRLEGVDGDDRSGSSVAPAGDVNGDGADDLIIGAPSAYPRFRYRGGETYVVFGRTASMGGFPAAFQLSSLDGATGFRLEGLDRLDLSGASVASAGDVNGDGADDLIIGAPSADPSGLDSAGETYVVFGRNLGPACRPDLDADGTLTIFDFLAFQNLFDLMDPRADFDGDGDFTIFDFLAFQNAFDAGCP